MVRFVAAQDVRTPLSFLDAMRRWHQQLPELLETTIRKALSDLEAAEGKVVAPKMKPEPNEFADLLTVTVERTDESSFEPALLRAEVPVGRRLWIASIRHLLTGVANVLCRHRWSVAEPFEGAEWPLTDHPVLRLNYYNAGHYDFGGGWGNPGSEIMMPVSSRHLLYVRVGTKSPNRLVLSRDHTELVQRLLVERAYRWVFGTRPADWVSRFKPRVVNLEQFKAERQAWFQWHQEQLRSEASLAQHGGASETWRTTGSSPLAPQCHD